MPRASRNRNSSPAPADEDEEGLDGLNDAEEIIVEGNRALTFNQELTWRAGKPIVVAELLRRLKALYEELRGIEQEDAHRSSTVPKAQDLASQQLLGHRDNGVKAWTLLCIVEMFRLLAPDAPYKQSQLKEIFNLLVSFIVPALAKPNDPYNSQHLSILQSLVTVKSILLLQDAPGSERLILLLFQNCFDIISGSGREMDGEQLSKNVEFYMTGMLTILIDEGPPLSSSVTDVLLAQFLRADPQLLSRGKKGTAISEDDYTQVLPAYNMAKSICNTCEDVMTRHIGTYFASVLVSAQDVLALTKTKKSKGKKRTHDDSEDESEIDASAPAEENDLEEVAKAHRLLRELWKSCPGLVRNVVPQIEQEVGAENVRLRKLGVETLGDMIAGIGAAGPPPPPVLDPAAYPSQSLESRPEPLYHNILLAPAAPHAFSSVYPSAYQGFHDRHNDRDSSVRCAWAAATSWILCTSAGGKGLDGEQESSLLRCLSNMLIDGDEKVRLSAVQALTQFDFNFIVQKVGSLGTINTEGSYIARLADRVRDTKPPVRNAAIQILGRIWGVAAGSIVEGRERVRHVLGWIPTHILQAIYANEPSLNALVSSVMFESLLPIGYPPKSKTSNGDISQRIADSQSIEEAVPDPDKLRVDRLLVLVRDLDGEKAKRAFFSMYGPLQTSRAKYLLALMERADKGKKAGKDDQTVTDKMVDAITAHLPEPSLAAHQLSVFLGHHDRRNFSLVKFCVQPESEYRKVSNAIRELTKRLEQAPNNVVGCLPTVIAILRQASYLIYNRSHIPAIMDATRQDDEGLAAAAHELLKHISANAPAVFKIHIKDLCETLKSQAPSASVPNDPSAADSLKTCAGFARHFPKDLGQDREFYKAMVKFALHGAPPRAAKHAVAVLVLSSEKREMFIQEILKSCVKHFSYGEANFLARMAALSQLRLMAFDSTEEHEDAVTEIATTVLRHTADMDDDTITTEDDDLVARLLALKMFVNGVRGRMVDSQAEEASNSVKDSARRVFRLLNTLVEKEGELSTTGSSTSEQVREQLRLAAAKLTLKMCCDKRLARLFTASDFNRLTKIAQDESADVRAGFSMTLEKYLNAGKLDVRFYSLLFVYAFEPVSNTKDRTTTFLRARTMHHSRLGDQAMERVFGYFLGVLAHHPDFGKTAEDLEDFIEYIVFYLRIVSTEKNLPALYSVAQRLKTVEDAINPAKSEDLYVLSDLTEAVMRHFAELQGWSLQIMAAKARLPIGLYAPISSTTAHDLSEKNFLPNELVEDLEDKVKRCLKTRKRKAQDTSGKSSKKVKTPKGSIDKTENSQKVLKVSKSARSAKTPNKSRADALPSSERRKSGRTPNARNYVENDDSEDDQELERWQAANDDDNDDEDDDDVEMQDEGAEDDDANKENVRSPTPPTSQTMHMEEEEESSARKPPASRRQKQPTSSKPVATKATAATRRKKDSSTTTKELPARGGRTTARTAVKKTQAKDEYDLPSDSE